MSPVDIAQRRPGKRHRTSVGKMKLGTAGKRWKAWRAEQGRAHCDACGWLVGPDVAEAFPQWWSRLLHAHHIVPRGFGGKDRKSNLILLCPTCHALAHLVCQAHRSDGFVFWKGPANAAELLALMECFFEPNIDSFATPDAKSVITPELRIA